MSPHVSSVDAPVCEGRFRRDELRTVGHVSTLFLAPEREQHNAQQKTTSLKMKLMSGCGPSGAPLRDPDSEIPRVPPPRLFQDRCRSSFIFSYIKPCFFSDKYRWERLTEAR